LETVDLKVDADLIEIVLFRGEAAKKSHKNLFVLDNSCYLSAGEKILNSVSAVCRENLKKLHIVCGWGIMLKVALWTEDLAVHDVLSIFKKCGVTDEELTPFKRSEIDDLFPWLYYGKRADVLRKICNAAKSKAESKAGVKHLRVFCHLVSEETERIVASSL
jgi:hypothetical protein